MEFRQALRSPSGSRHSSAAKRFKGCILS